MSHIIELVFIRLLCTYANSSTYSYIDTKIDQFLYNEYILIINVLSHPLIVILNHVKLHLLYEICYY